MKIRGNQKKKKEIKELSIQKVLLNERGKREKVAAYIQKILMYTILIGLINHLYIFKLFFLPTKPKKNHPENVYQSICLHFMQLLGVVNSDPFSDFCFVSVLQICSF